MDTTFDSESWLEGRLARARDRFLRGEIDEALYRSTVANLWVTYDNFSEYSCVVASAKVASAGLEHARALEGYAE